MTTEMIGRLVGQSVRRSEDTRILTGTGRYVDDVRLPGMLHAAFVRSPEPHAPIHDEVGENRTAPPSTRSWGEVDDVFAQADRVIEATFAQSRHANVPMETRGAVASYDPSTGELTVHASTQGAHGVKGALAA